MSPAPADLVNALELAGKAASIERDVDRSKLPRLMEAGALEGTRAHGVLRFGLFEGHATVDARVSGMMVLRCERCLGPCEVPVAESSMLIVIATEDVAAPAGFDPILGDAERLPVIDVIEEQLLLALPLVATHRPGTSCRLDGAADAPVDVADDRQLPFSNLRELLDRKEQ